MELQSFSLSRKCHAVFRVESQEDMHDDGTLVKAPPDIQKEDDAAHATAELALVNRGYVVAN